MRPYRSTLIVISLAISLVGAVAAGSRVSGRTANPDLSGTWTLNKELSMLPDDVGFDLVLPKTTPDQGTQAGTASRGGGGGGGRGGGRGGGGQSGAGSTTSVAAVPALKASAETEEDAKRRTEIVAEVKTPPATLTITQTTDTLRITDAQGRTRVFHVNAKEDIQQLESGPIVTTTKWDKGQLVVNYAVQKDRVLRYTYTREAGASRLTVAAQLLEHGKGDAVTRVYDLTPR